MVIEEVPRADGVRDDERLEEGSCRDADNVRVRVDGLDASFESHKPVDTVVSIETWVGADMDSVDRASPNAIPNVSSLWNSSCSFGIGGSEGLLPPATLALSWVKFRGFEVDPFRRWSVEIERESARW